MRGASIAVERSAGGMAAALVALGASGILRPSIIVASAPGLITASAIAAQPPSPGRLRTIGWALVGVSILTAALVITTG